MKLPQPVAWNFQPRLVRVVREKLAGPPVSGGGRGCASFGIAVQSSDSLLGTALELVDVYDHMGLGKQRDGVARQNQRARVAQRTAGKVRRLVQPRARIVDRGVRPQCVDHLLPVQRAAGRQREQFDQRRRVSAAPLRGRNWPAVDPDGEAAQ